MYLEWEPILPLDLLVPDDAMPPDPPALCPLLCSLSSFHACLLWLSQEQALHHRLRVFLVMHSSRDWDVGFLTAGLVKGSLDNHRLLFHNMCCSCLRAKSSYWGFVNMNSLNSCANPMR